MPPELGEGVRQAAARQGTSVSSWLTEAAADKLRNELLGAALRKVSVMTATLADRRARSHGPPATLAASGYNAPAAMA